MGLSESLTLICALVLYKYLGDSMSANTLNLVKNVFELCLLIPTLMLVEGLVLSTGNVSIMLASLFGAYLAVLF